AIAYDVFRLPWVIGAANAIGPTWLRLPLFKVFPRFGALILGQPFTQTQSESQFTPAAHVVGWVYHLSNGVTFGIMYLAIVGDATRQSWLWAVLLAAGIEAMMLITPDTSFFAIAATAIFVAVTLPAHIIFGTVLGR